MRPDGVTASRRYWHLHIPKAQDVRPIDPARKRSPDVRQRVTSAVERRLASDVPLGAFLSGGLDSTIVVGVMSRLMSEPVQDVQHRVRGR